MTIERIPVTDRASWLALRQRDVTASAVGCLLGVHEFWTPLALWAIKTGAIKEDPEESAPMRRGRLLEPVAIQLLREERPTWKVEPPGVYLRDPDARLGATPDLFVDDPDRGPGVVQLKTVEPGVFRRKWTDAETREVNPPLWVAVQAITEAHLANVQWAAVVAMTVSFGVDMHLIDVPIHDGVVTRVRSAVADFWRTVDAGRKPEPVLSKDGSLIEDLYAPTGDIADLTGMNDLPSLADERERLSAAKTSADKRLKEIKAEFLVKMNGASAAHIAGGRIITAKRVSRAGYSVEPTSYIDVRVKHGNNPGVQNND